MSYYVDARSYLNRARTQLDEGTPEAVFYAAFELRCGIEKRMREYLEAWDHVAEKKKQAWKISPLGKTIDETFKLGGKVAKLTISSTDMSKTYGVYYYTPVSEDLQQMAGRLGNYLHAPLEYRELADEWWRETREFLEEIYSELKRACSGTLLGPPLVLPNGQWNMPMELYEKAPAIREVGVGDEVIIRVEYPDEYPAELKNARLPWFE